MVMGNGFSSITILSKDKKTIASWRNEHSDIWKKTSILVFIGYAKNRSRLIRFRDTRVGIMDGYVARIVSSQANTSK